MKMTEDKKEFWRWKEYNWHDESIDWKGADIISAGVDVGSVSSQAVVMVDGQPYAFSNMRTGSDSPNSAKNAMDWALENTGMAIDDIHYIVGTHDFKAFEAVGSPRSSTIRNVMNAGLFEHVSDYLIFEIKADGFLRFMVRNLVGTLVDVGLHKITVKGFQQILLSKERERAGVTAPPEGLFLLKVAYE